MASKEKIIQELQKRSIDFDGGASKQELEALLADNSDPADNDVNAPGATNNEDKANPIVQPLQAADVKTPVLKGERCWNCYAQDKKTRNRLNEDGVCDVCGFEKDLLYNGNIEADKAAQRAEEARAAERG